ncbi:haloacid dehalogenase-like hydrolase [Candidatus Woesearchaeota archaeon]|nr:haloacid dehalogenase-like hydrolase [Candidatus Woesearchaeota archaeon]
MKRIGFFYDFDLTLSEELQQTPILKKYAKELEAKYKITEPIQYFLKLCKQFDKSVEWMEQMLQDSNEIFNGLTNEKLEKEFGPQIKLAKGLPEFFSIIKEELIKQGFECEHHVISVGVDSLIKGTKIYPEVNSVISGKFEEDENGINKIGRIVSEFRKVEHIKNICKGKKMHSDLSLNEYYINYKNVFVFGDGASDIDMFRFILQRGGVAIAVFEQNNNEGYKKAVENLGNSVNVIVPRDYTDNSRLKKVILEIIKERIEAEGKCDMDYELIHNYKLGYIENNEIQKIIKKHLENCEHCQNKLKKRFYFD